MRLLGVTAIVLLLAGCTLGGSVGDPDPPDGPDPLIPITHPHVQLSCPDVPTHHLGTGQVDDVETVVRCTAEVRDIEGVPNTVQSVLRLVGDADDVLEAYTAPDLQSPDDEPCESYAPVDPLILWLDFGDRIESFYAPLDDCGFPQAAAAAAVAGAEWETIFVAREVVE